MLRTDDGINRRENVEAERRNHKIISLKDKHPSTPTAETRLLDDSLKPYGNDEY
jgi:hypothetical protein